MNTPTPNCGNCFDATPATHVAGIPSLVAIFLCPRHARAHAKGLGVPGLDKLPLTRLGKNKRLIPQARTVVRRTKPYTR